MLKRQLGRYVLSANEESDRDTSSFGNSPQVDEVLTVSIVERQHDRGCPYFTALQELNRLTEANHPIKLSKKIHAPQELFRGDPETVRTVGDEMEK
jgi:hypothetical protein